jgi:hypothetical protein
MIKGKNMKEGRIRTGQVKYRKPRVQKKYIYDIHLHYLFSFRTSDDYCKLQITKEHTFNGNLTPEFTT